MRAILKVFHNVFSFLLRLLWGGGVLLQGVKFGRGCRFNSFSRFPRRTTIGSGSHFNGVDARGHGRLVIGSGVHCGKGLSIFTSTHNYDSETDIPYDSTYVDKDVSVGDYVWLGANVIVLPGVSIGEGAIVGAGSVVTKSVKAFEIVAGNPARVIKRRDVEKYMRVKGLLGGGL